MALSLAQLKALRRARRTMRPFGGRQLKTLESLANRGLLTYFARMECTVCARYDCTTHRSSRWRAWAEPTAAGVALLEQLSLDALADRETA